MMTRQQLLVVFLESALLFAVVRAGDESGCLLRNGEASSRPYPSLTQCYKNNQGSCCVSAHDASISTSYDELLSSACLRMFEDLEHYFCMGCNPEMYDFVQWYDIETKQNCLVGGDSCEFQRFNAGASTDWKDLRKNGKYGMLRICDSFMNRLLFASEGCDVADQSSSCTVDRYDACGLIIGQVGVLPSTYFVNATGSPDYRAFFETIRPPYFSAADFDISVEYLKDSQSAESDSQYYEPWESDAICFSAAPRAFASLFSMTLVVFVGLFLTRE